MSIIDIYYTANSDFNVDGSHQKKIELRPLPMIVVIYAIQSFSYNHNEYYYNLDDDDKKTAGGG